MAPHYDLDPERKYSIAVVGGGIGGLCTAIGLLHHGVNCEIYEGTTVVTLSTPAYSDTWLSIIQLRAPLQR